MAVERLELPPGRLTYIMEGNVNVVCAIDGHEDGPGGLALRCRKLDNGACRFHCGFVNSMAARLLGEDYVESGTLVGLSPANMRAIDDAIFASRPPERISKRLDTEARDASGMVLALRLPNLLAAPLAGYPMVTVEIKPKCGLVERQGLPARYTLLQYHKLAEGRISRVSAFDPIKLLGKQPQAVRQALQDMLDEPQNNLRVFAGARAVFDDRLCNEGRRAAGEALDVEMRAAGLQGTDHLLSLLVALLCSEEFTVPERLKRLQAWAAGETAKVAEQLYGGLRSHLGDVAAEEELSRLESYQLAADGLEAFPCDEAGINAATAQMDALLAKASSEDWTEAVQREVVRWLCRFLLSRIAHDVSVMINFAHVSAEALTPKNREILASRRFKALDTFSFPGVDLPCTGLWCRATIVDLDPKSPQKIPEYARSLDKYAKAYYRRFSRERAASMAVDPAAPAGGAEAPGDGGAPRERSATDGALGCEGKTGKICAFQ